MTLLATALFALACQRLPDGRETLIAFNVSDVKVETGVTTRVSETVASTLNSNGIYVNCTQGSAGSETSVWSNVHFTYSGGTFSENKWWPASNPSYHFYASSSAIAHTAAGATVAATNDADVVCAYSPNPTFAVTNTLVFNHIFARLGSVTFTASSGYTITGITATITPKTGGTYNLRTGAWSSVTTGSATSIANSTPGTKNNDIYLVPGTYTVTASWTATKGGYTKTFTDRTYDVELVAGYVNTLTASFGGNATDIQFTVGVEAWENNALALGAYPHENPATFGGLEIARGNLYYGSSGYEILDDWQIHSCGSIYGKSVGSTYFNAVDMGKLFQDPDYSETDLVINNVLDPFDGWRLPTLAECYTLTTGASPGTSRPGATINGVSGCKFCAVKLSGTFGGISSPTGFLLAPDDIVLSAMSKEFSWNSASSLPSQNQNTTEEELNEYLNSGCIFFLDSGIGNLQRNIAGNWVISWRNSGSESKYMTNNVTYNTYSYRYFVDVLRGDSGVARYSSANATSDYICVRLVRSVN